MTIEISLQDYSSITAQSFNFDVVFTLSCVDATIVVPDANSTSLADAIYVVSSAIESQSYSDITSDTTYTSLLDCGPINFIWYQSTAVAAPSIVPLNDGISPIFYLDEAAETFVYITQNDAYVGTYTIYVEAQFADHLSNVSAQTLALTVDIQHPCTITTL